MVGTFTILSSTPPKRELDQTQNAQPCLLLCELAVLRILRRLAVPYEAVAGFSLGEWAALVAAGTAQEEDVLTVIEKRADAMQRAVPLGEGGMAVILGKDAAFVETLCAKIGDVFPANYNCPGNIAVAGRREAIDRLLEQTEQDEIMTTRIAVSVPSHCPLMAPAAQELEPAIQVFPVQPPIRTLYMNATGKPATEPNEVRENLLFQLSHPVRFLQALESLLDAGYDTFLEAGPGKALCGMVKRTAKAKGVPVRALPLSDPEAWDEICRLSTT